MESNAMDHGAGGAHNAAQPASDARDVAVDAGAGRESPREHLALLGATSSNNSQSATDGHDTISTPQTSSDDGPASQANSQDATMTEPSQPSQQQLAPTQDGPLESSASRPGVAVPPTTAGQKRMADGQVKPPSPPSPAGPRFRGHSRNTSAVSNVSSANSRIGELSSELRTRLSYAMVKVNNGWQSNTIEEVESLASLTGSPASSTSTLHGRRNVAASPRANMIAMQGQSANPISQPPLGGDFDLFSRTESASRTYESFWRDHPTSTSGPSQQQQRPPYATSPPPPKASLAPPADIRPGTGTGASSRRSQTPKFSKPPAMPAHRSDPTPRTPTQSDSRDRPARGVQTPSQKTIQEQDAIETLLFMSSPGNSNSIAHGAAFGAAPRTNSTSIPNSNPHPLLGSPHRSPLRAEFRVQDRRGAHAHAHAARRVDFGKHVGEEARRPQNPGAAAGLDESREGVIDRLLDRMSDASRSSSGSSSDGDIEVPLSYEPRVAGRV